MNQKTKMGYTSQKGITLIALVITIIVLLVLAGVTISMVLGDDGIIANAQTAKEEQQIAELKEKIHLWNGNVETAEYSDDKITEEEYNEFQEEVQALAEKAGIEGVDIGTGKVEIDGEEVAVQMPSNIDLRRDIKFTVDGTELIAKEGMTWGEFINNPELCTNKEYYVITEDGTICADWGVDNLAYLMDYGYYEAFGEYKNRAEKITDTIRENGDYYFE